MPYQATVLPVMIASPGDVHEYRAIARDVIHEWNYIHSASFNVVLMPVGWETHSSPELGSTVQELINDRVLADCDLLVGIFWTRLGTPTGRASSGTVEEIQRHVAAGKPAMVYFSRAPAALDTVDADQYAALKDFRAWCQAQQGLIEFFDNGPDFHAKFRRHIQIALLQSDYLKSIAAQFDPARLSAHAQGSSPAADTNATIAASLSEEARALLLEASRSNDGLILVVNMLAGRVMQANGKTLNDPDDRRSTARWEYALEQLSTFGLIALTNDGAKGDRFFEVAETGYRVAEYLEKLAK